MHLFYTQDIRANLAFLPEDESRHAISVLRLQVGASIDLTDGLGHFYKGQISNIGKKQCIVSIDTTVAESPKPYHLSMAVAPTKNIDRYEWFVEKAVEIGIDEIIPLKCQRSERTTVRIDRLHGVAVSAMKQSLKASLPKIPALIDFKNFIKNLSTTSQRFIAHCGDDNGQHLSLQCAKGQDTLILIGPEGDFSPEEVAIALQNGFKPISLGTSRLRTETAAVVACTTVSILNAG